MCFHFLFFKQMTAHEVRISDWSSDVCSSDLAHELMAQLGHIDTLDCSVGTGGHSAGIARVLRRFCPDLKLVGVDTVGPPIFGQPEVGRAPCRDRVCQYVQISVGAVSLTKKSRLNKNSLHTPYTQRAQE